MKRLKPSRLLIIGGLCFAAAIVIRLPASLLAGAAPAPLQLAGVSGTLWSGRAAQIGIHGQELVRGLVWRWQPASLLRGELGWTLASTDTVTPLSGQLRAGFGGIRLDDLSARLPAAPIFNLAKPLLPFQLGGTLLISAKRLDRHTLIDTSAQWLDANSLVTPQANPFGSYKLALQQQGNTLGWQMTPLGGRLVISGHGNLGPTGPRGSLTLEAAEGQAAAFAPLLDRLPGNGKAHTLQLGPAAP
ncbi:hypothetical protein JHS3_14550 [Jeongeupia sp. HS-3]|uniref:type II secretion system protein N n=1 Tax=Jeongeupia sp. HS-3 TaxID=1009682 RepID=UPI0018A3F387|nr:type II secretion system protein N [Jeongeupia sp. HS-3]BCL75719.1 hypothetical protein JHS3_14550 [Jeongeupia sp. HS-3]